MAKSIRIIRSGWPDLSGHLDAKAGPCSRQHGAISLADLGGFHAGARPGSLWRWITGRSNGSTDAPIRGTGTSRRLARSWNNDSNTAFARFPDLTIGSSVGAISTAFTAVGRADAVTSRPCHGGHSALAGFRPGPNRGRVRPRSLMVLCRQHSGRGRWCVRDGLSLRQSLRGVGYGLPGGRLRPDRGAACLPSFQA